MIIPEELIAIISTVLKCALLPLKFAILQLQFTFLYLNTYASSMFGWKILLMKPLMYEKILHIYYHFALQTFFQDSKFSLTLSLPRSQYYSPPYCLPYMSYFYPSLIDFQNFSRPVAFFQDFPVLENTKTQFQDFPGFPGPIQTLC